MAGAVSGNDELVEEGQLQQAAAGDRKAALADEAVADAGGRKRRVRELRQAGREAAEVQGATRAEAQRDEARVEQQRFGRARGRRRYEALQQETAARGPPSSGPTDAETRLREAEAIAAHADSTEREAAAQKRRLESQAAVADQQAAQLRARTQK